MTVLFAAILPVVILFCGLALDVGMIEMKTLRLQSAADAAALGAEIEYERNTGNWVTMGQQDAGINGFTNGTNNVTVAIVQQPSTGPYAGDYDALQATVSQQVNTIFMGTLNGGKFTVMAQAVALVPPCAYFFGLNTTDNPDPFWVKNTSDSLTTTCPLYIGTGLDVEGATLSAGAENVTGPAGSSTVTGTATPAPRYNAATMTDPLALIVSPSFSSCTVTSYSLSSGSATLNPGTYCGGMQLTSSTVTLNPGLYILTGGSTWNGSTVTGTGVTIFMTQGGGSGFGMFNIDGTSTIALTAPTDSSHGGVPTIVVMTDRSWSDAAHNEDFQCSASTITGDGIYYTTGTGQFFTHCTISAPNYLGMVADNLYSSGSTISVASNYSNITTGNPFHPLGGLVQ